MTEHEQYEFKIGELEREIEQLKFELKQERHATARANKKMHDWFVGNAIRGVENFDLPEQRIAERAMRIADHLMRLRT